MLAEVYVNNLAIMKDERISFGHGFNVITGESGSGKSILIEAISLLMGKRAQKSLVGSNGDKLYVEGVFTDLNDQVLSELNQLGIEAEEDKLIVSREIPLDKTASNRLNGRSVTLSTWKRVLIPLMDIHKQNASQSLLNKGNYIDLIDRYAGDYYDLLDDLGDLIKREKSLIKDLERLPENSEDLEREKDLLKYQIQEIEEIDLDSLDEEALDNEYEKLSHNQEILETINQVLDSLTPMDYERTGAIDMLRKVKDKLEKISSYDSSITGYTEEVEDSVLKLEELSYSLESYVSGLEPDDERIGEINEIYDKLLSLKRKYGPEIEDIRKFYEESLNKLDQLEHSEERRTALENDLNEIRIDIRDLSSRISERRKGAAGKLSSDLLDSIYELEMYDTRFEIRFEDLDHFTEKGMDDVDFYISTNKGEDLEPISKVASGGELSRVMLAFKSVIADIDEIPSLVFDEIDTGLSGKAANIVGDKIQKISEKHQVIAVSHLPQIAAKADNHILIYKETEGLKTHSHVKMLSGEERRVELARLISGDKITDVSLKNAEELLQMHERKL